MRSDETPSLPDLLRLAAAGDELAQRTLYKRFASAFLRAAQRLLRLKGCSNPEDHSPQAADSAWDKIFENLGRLRNPESFKYWATRIIENKVNAHLRFCIRHQGDFSIDDYQKEAATLSSEEELQIAAQSLDRVMAVARTINPHLPDILTLRYGQGLTHIEIAEELGLSYVNVRLIHSRGLSKLRPLLRDKATLARLGL